MIVDTNNVDAFLSWKNKTTKIFSLNTNHINKGN